MTEEEFLTEISQGSIKIDQKIDAKNNRPLHLAVQNNWPATTATLIKKGHNINIQNNLKETPLLIAIATSNLTMVNQLLAEGANHRINANSLQTALHKAVLKENATLVKILLEHDQQKNPETTLEYIEAAALYGETAYSLARKQKNQAIISLLKEAITQAKKKKDPTYNEINDLDTSEEVLTIPNSARSLPGPSESSADSDPDGLLQAIEEVIATTWVDNNAPFFLAMPPRTPSPPPGLILTTPLPEKQDLRKRQRGTETINPPKKTEAPRKKYKKEKLLPAQNKTPKASRPKKRTAYKERWEDETSEQKRKRLAKKEADQTRYQERLTNPNARRKKPTGLFFNAPAPPAKRPGPSQGKKF